MNNWLDNWRQIQGSIRAWWNEKYINPCALLHGLSTDMIFRWKRQEIKPEYEVLVGNVQESRPFGKLKKVEQ
jgi:hypothetical protein